LYYNIPVISSFPFSALDLVYCSTFRKSELLIRASNFYQPPPPCFPHAALWWDPACVSPLDARLIPASCFTIFGRCLTNSVKPLHYFPIVSILTFKGRNTQRHGAEAVLLICMQEAFISRNPVPRDCSGFLVPCSCAPSPKVASNPPACQSLLWTSPDTTLSTFSKVTTGFRSATHNHIHVYSRTAHIAVHVSRANR